MKLSFLIISVTFLIIGCATKQESTKEESTIPSYVTIPPITLPPIAPEIKDTLMNIAENTKNAKVVPFDLDLLVLPASSVKAQYSFLDLNMNATATMFSTSGTSGTRKAIYDVMQMATYPMPIVLRNTNNNVNPSSQTIYVAPFIGVGIRITVEYEASNIKGNLSLSALATELSSKKGSGSISIEQFGISRYGTMNQGITGMEITPDNIDALHRNISSLMAQLWLEDTSIQPMLVGYSIPGYVDIPSRYHSQIVDQLATTARQREIVTVFSESMFRESKRVLRLNGDLVSKDGNVATSAKYAKQIESLEDKYKSDIRINGLVTTIALTNPEKLPQVTDAALDNAVVSPNTTTNEAAATKIILDINSQKKEP